MLGWVERSVEVLLTFKFFLFLDALCLLPLGQADSLRVILCYLPEEIQERIHTFLNDVAEVVSNLEICNPIRHVALLLPFIHFGHKLLDFHPPRLGYCLHNLLNVRLQSEEINLLE